MSVRFTRSHDPSHLTHADLAVAAARRAFESGPWASYHGSQRRECMLRLAALMEDNADELALIEARDNGALLKSQIIIIINRDYVSYH